MLFIACRIKQNCLLSDDGPKYLHIITNLIGVH